MTKKEITIEDLAIMTEKGFSGVHNKIDEEIKNLRNDMNKRFDEVDERFDRIENITLRNHENKIENLEDKMRKVETAN